MKNIFSVLFVCGVLVSCSRAREVEVSVPIGQDPRVRVNLGESQENYEIFGSDSLRQALERQELKATSKRAIRSQSLLVAFPKKLLGENFVFGGVVTKVSDTKNESLGNLKLSDLPPIFVQPELSVHENDFKMDLKGCLEKCGESSSGEVVLSIPIVALDMANERVVLDLAALGEKLNLIKMIDPKGDYTQLKTTQSQVVAVDYSVSTLVFDVEVTMIPLGTAAEQPASDTKFTIRWYLRLGSFFNPSFIPRDKTEGVGFFMTERTLYPKIQRHSLSKNAQGSVKYFVKNIPQEHKKSFKRAFESWNEKFIEISGRPLLDFEFVDADDPRAPFLIPGDIRYNILEWDLENQASYGGLGPSIANQFTGEILSSNVLVQGPRILEIYQSWFKVSEAAQALKSQGKAIEAERLLKTFILKETKRFDKNLASRFDLTLGSRAKFKIHSQLTPSQDPVFKKDDFDAVPAGVSYEQYMNGYFLDLVAHELGHNLGLRHNFFGNLSAAEGPPIQGKVSSSIMEYLGRRFRYLDEIGTYDVMALNYGYMGVLPSLKNAYCTDEQVPDIESPTLSAECSRDDATNDPFRYFVSRLNRAIDLVISRGSSEAPAWKADEMIKTTSSAVNGLAFYASSAEAAGESWTQFFNKLDRPKSSGEVPEFVLRAMDQALCPFDLGEVLAMKTFDAQLETKLNLLSYIKAVNDNLKAFKFDRPVGQKCLE